MFKKNQFPQDTNRKMSKIIRLNPGLEKIVKNPHFTKSNPFDYSKGSSTPIDEYMRTGRIQSKPLFRDQSKPLFCDSVKIKASDIERFGDFNPRFYQFLLVPVGFTSVEASEVLFGIIYYLKNAFQKVPVQFSYLSTSISIPIDHIGHCPFFADKESEPILKEIDDLPQVNGFIAVMNTDEHLGSSEAFSGKSWDRLYTACHELGHHFGLDDGYERYYQNVNGTELFTSLFALPGRIRYAAQKFKTPIYKTGNHFDGQAVYRFYQQSIMSGSPRYYETLLRTEKPVFNDLQNYIMHANARDAIIKQKRSK